MFRTLSSIYDGTFCKKQLPSALFSLSPQKFFLTKSALKKFLIFTQKSLPPNFQERKLFLYFRKGISGITDFSYISGNGTFQPCKLKKRKKKKKKNPLLKCFLCFKKWNFLTPNLKNFLYFRKELIRPSYFPITVKVAHVVNLKLLFTN